MTLIDHSPDDARAFKDIGALEQRVEALKQEVSLLKEDGKSWVKKWGAYLGILASIVAVPRAAVEAWNSIYQHPKFTVNQPVPLTIFYDAPKRVVTFSFPLYTSNYGTRAGDIRRATAHLSSKVATPQDLYTNESDFQFADDNNHPVPFPFQVPISTSKSLISSVEFRGRVLTTGAHRLEVTLKGGPSDPLPTMPMRFCFELTKDLIDELSQEPRRWLSTDCD